ncbi:MAG: DNA cytosine methyltransferase [Victivallaceae bacterium]
MGSRKTDRVIGVKDRSVKFKFIDLFAGIGGFHLAGIRNGGECVLACEMDEGARATYSANYKVSAFPKDITRINPEDIPDHDLLCAGFPCQPFSQAGNKKGFDDMRGTLFFYIAEILRIKLPKAFFLENVRYLLSHNGGRTFSIIRQILEELGYSFFHKIIKASDFGLPQHRPRLFMVGFKDRTVDFVFPTKIPLTLTMEDIFGKSCNKVIGFTLRVGGRGSKIHDRRNWDTYLVDNKEYRLRLKDCLKMMGFPEDFRFPVSETQAIKQLGNSVAVPAISKTVEALVKFLDLNF